MDLVCVQGFTSQNSKMDFHLLGALILTRDAGKCAEEQSFVPSATQKNKAVAESETGKQDFAENEWGFDTKKAGNKTEEEKFTTSSNGVAGINEGCFYGASAMGLGDGGARALSPLAFSASDIQSGPVALEPTYEFRAQDFSPNWEYVGSLKRCAIAYPDLSTILDDEDEEEDQPKNKRVQFTIGDNDDYSSDEEWGNPNRFRSNLCTIWEANEDEEDVDD